MTKARRKVRKKATKRVQEPGLRLHEVGSPEQLRAALKRGDPQLQRDIEERFSKLLQGAWRDSSSEWDFLDAEEIVTRVKQHFGGDLRGMLEDVDEISQMVQNIPPQRVNEALLAEITSAAAEMGPVGGRGSVVFQFATGQGPGETVSPLYVEYQVDLDERLKWLPRKTILEALEWGGPHGAKWEEVDEGHYSTGWVESADYLRLEIDKEALYEWAQDLRQEHFSELIDAEPKVAIAAMMRELSSAYPSLAKKIRKAKLPQEVLADYAVAFFQDPEEGVELLSEAMGVFGYEGTLAEVLLEIDRDTLRRLGVGDRWLEGAPWRLLNLPEQELAYEGTLQRHCVGRHDMGYREAVRRGETEIWSLRSRFNKPLLTFEIDKRAWDSAAGNPPHAGTIRGGAISQLKGKLNRTAGKDADESRVLLWIFEQLGIDPRTVSDFRPGRAANPRDFCARWRPYQQGRPPARRPPHPPRTLKRRLMR